MSQKHHSAKNLGSATQLDYGTGEHGRKLSGEAVSPPPSEKSEEDTAQGTISVVDVTQSVVSKKLAIKKTIKFTGPTQPRKEQIIVPKKDARDGDSQADIDIHTATKCVVALTLEVDSIEF